jgi:spermidine/putrescine transport system permease protein
MSEQPPSSQLLSTSVVAEEKRLRNTRLSLLAPGILTIFVIGIMPLSIVLVYSFLEPGDFGGVSWVLSFDAYVQLLFEEDIFDETLSFTTDYLEIFLRSILLGLFTTMAFRPLISSPPSRRRGATPGYS